MAASTQYADCTRLTLLHGQHHEKAICWCYCVVMTAQSESCGDAATLILSRSTGPSLFAIRTRFPKFEHQYWVLLCMVSSLVTKCLFLKYISVILEVKHMQNWKLRCCNFFFLNALFICFGTRLNKGQVGLLKSKAFEICHFIVWFKMQ